MATLVGQGFIEIVPRLAPGFGGQLEGQMVAGTAAAEAGAVKAAEGAGGASGRGFLGGMRGALSGMSGMIKAVAGVAAVAGVVDFAKQSVDAFKEVTSESVALQRVMGGTITQASEWRAVADRFGVSTSQMSVAMKTLSKDMVSGKGPLVELGIASKDSTGHMRPMGDVMLDIADKFQKMPNGAEKSRLAVQLFGKTGTSLLPILNQGSGGIQKFMEDAQRMGVVVGDNAPAQLKKMKMAQADLHESVEGLKVSFGSDIMPALATFVSFLAQHVVPVIGAVVNFVQRNKDVFGPLAAVILAAAAAFKVASIAMAAFNAVMDANPIVLIAAAIAALAVAVVLLWTHWNEVWNWIMHHKAYAIIIGLMVPIAGQLVLLVGAVRYLYQNWDSIWKAIQGVAEIAWHYLDTGLQAMASFFVSVWHGLYTAVMSVWAGIQTAVHVGVAVVSSVISAGMAVVRTVWNAAWTVMSTLATAAWTVIRAVVNAGITVIRSVISAGMTVIHAVWSASWTVMSTIASAVWTAIRAVVQAGIAVLRSVISAGLTVISAVWNAAWTVIKTTFTVVWTVLRTIALVYIGLIAAGIKAALIGLQAAWNAIWNAIKVAFQAIWNALKAICGPAIAWIASTITTVWHAVQGVFSTVWNAIRAAFEAVWNVLKAIVGAATSWISSTINTVWHVVYSVFQTVWNAIRSFFETLWNILRSIVGAATSWIATTINNAWHVVYSVFQTVWNAIRGFFENLWNILKLVVGAATSWIASTVSNAWHVVSGIFESIWSSIRNTFSTIWENIKTIASNAINWIRDTIHTVTDTISSVWRTAWTGMKDTLKSIWDGIVDVFKKPLNVVIAGLNAFFTPINDVIDWAIGKKPLPHLQSLATGGRLPGYGGGDTIPAMLEPGEAVVPKHLVAEMAPWARSRGIPGFVDGGMVGVPLWQQGVPGPVNRGDWWNPIDDVTAAAKAVGGAVEKVAGLVGDAAKWVYEKGTGLLRIGAGVAAQAILTPIKAGVDATVGNMGQPGKMAAGIFNKTTQSIIDWVKGKEGPDPSAGGGAAGGVADSNKVVAFAKTLIGDPYRPPYYSPAGFSCDGLVWYVFNHFGINLPKGATNQMNAVQRLSAGQQQPGDVVGFHQNGPSAGNPLGLEFHHIGLVTGADQMIDALGTLYGVRVDSISNIDSGPGHYVRFGRVLQNLNPGWGTPAYKAAHAAGAQAGSGKPWTQSQMEMAIRGAGANATVAHIMGAIAMNENPNSTRYSNNTGTYDSPWALQEAWTIPMGLDINRLNNDLNYAAQQAYAAYLRAGNSFSPWEAYTNGNYLRNMRAGGLVGASYDTGGFLPTGLSLAWNGTGRPEPVGAATTVQHATVNLTLNVANGEPVTMRAAAQQVVDDALTALARKLSSGAGRN